ncbi:hypothetical protein Naga_102570g1, partial [Nannochloropsis gaditana]
LPGHPPPLPLRPPRPARSAKEAWAEGRAGGREGPRGIRRSTGSENAATRALPPPPLPPPRPPTTGSTRKKARLPPAKCNLAWASVARRGGLAAAAGALPTYPEEREEADRGPPAMGAKGRGKGRGGGRGGGGRGSPIQGARRTFPSRATPARRATVAGAGEWIGSDRVGARFLFARFFPFFFFLSVGVRVSPLSSSCTFHCPYIAPSPALLTLPPGTERWTPAPAITHREGSTANANARSRPASARRSSKRTMQRWR